MNEVAKYKEQPNPPKRPSQRDVVIRRAAAAKCLDKAIIEWAEGDYKPERREEWIDDLADVMAELDGYAAARKLEYHHWAPNFELCEILDGSWIRQAERDAVLLWVQNNCIKPKFEIGEQVEHARYGKGTIVGIDVARANYTVQTEEWLEKNPDQRGKNGGYCLPFEECR